MNLTSSQARETCSFPPNGKSQILRNWSKYFAQHCTVKFKFAFIMSIRNKFHRRLSTLRVSTSLTVCRSWQHTYPHFYLISTIWGFWFKTFYRLKTHRIFLGSKIFTSLFLLHLFAASHHHHHHRHPFAKKKLTHSHFPKGGYILVHYPTAHHHKVASNQNKLIENSLSSESVSNDLPNDILPHDINLLQDSSLPNRRAVDSHKYKYTMKFKRNAEADTRINIEYCCEHSPQDSCDKDFC